MSPGFLLNSFHSSAAKNDHCRKNNLGVFYFIVFQLMLSTLSSCREDSSVEFNLKGDGFHREMFLSSSINFPSSRDCKILLKWTVPPGAYVDPYQLQSMVENKTAHFTSSVDIEGMAHFSPSQGFYIYPSLTCNRDFQCTFSQFIPVHARYHLPNAGMKHSAEIELAPPSMYSSCNNPTKIGCFNETDKSCDWNTLLVNSPSKQLFHIPVGDLNHSLLVTLFTICVTLVGTASVTFSVIKN